MGIICNACMKERMQIQLEYQFSQEVEIESGNSLDRWDDMDGIKIWVADPSGIGAVHSCGLCNVVTAMKPEIGGIRWH